MIAIAATIHRMLPVASLQISALGAASALAFVSICSTAIGWVAPRGVLPGKTGRRGIGAAGIACGAAVALLAAAVGMGLVAKGLGWPERAPGMPDGIALAATAAAATVRLWDPNARFALAGLYGLGLAAVGMQQIHRFEPGQFYVWACAAEWSGFVLVAAAIGWSLPRMKPVWRMLGIADRPVSSAPKWFQMAQATLAALAAALAAWISIDFSFDGIGRGVALFGFEGRLDGCPTALMLVGATILMAWQTDGAWRTGWQYAAMAAGVLFTSSVGWARVDPSVDPHSVACWFDRSLTLLLSSSMMTLLTGFGLGRILPRQNDWIVRGRHAVRYFGSLALAMLAIVALLAVAA